jgi:hypothetical protein
MGPNLTTDDPPADVVATAVSAALVKKGLIRPRDAKPCRDRISRGVTTGADWRLWIENGIAETKR